MRIFGFLIFFVCGAAAAAAASSNSSEQVKRFVFVHGAGHGGWCWFQLSSRLQQLGYIVDAIDLTSAGIDKADARFVNTLQNYSAPLTNLLQTIPNKSAILVGHSLGGLSNSLAMELFPEKFLAAVYVTALMLPPNATQARSLFNELVSKNQDHFTFSYLNGSTTPVAYAFKLEGVQELLYQKSKRQVVELAKTLLQAAPFFDPAVNLTSARYGSIPRYFIKATEDRAILPEDQELMIQTTPPTKVFAIDSDHSPFFSRPELLLKYLIEIAKDVESI